MRTFAVFAFFVVASLICNAAPRWCTFSSSNKILYPPIARAARIQGTVLMRVIYTPEGKFLHADPVSGPVMLSDRLAQQVSTWTLKTDATGEEQCVSLMVVDFHFHNPDEKLKPAQPRPNTPSVFYASVEEEVLIISDPGAVISTNPFKVFAYKIKRLTRAIFPSKNLASDY